MKYVIRLLLPVLLLSFSVVAQEGMGFDPEIDEMLERVEKGERPERRTALDTLFRRKDERLDAIVLRILENTKEDEVTEDILRGIGLNKVGAGLQPAIDRLSHKKAGVRSYAAVCLERLENREAMKELLKRAGKEKDRLALKNALRALGKVAPGDADVATILVKRFTHKENVVAANAVLAASSFKEEGRVRSQLAERVAGLLTRTSDIRVRSACLYSVGAIGTEAQIPDLQKFKKTFQGSMNPLAAAAIGAADTAIELIRSGSTDPMSEGGTQRLFTMASDDERDPARDGDPTLEEPAWMNPNPRGGWGGRGGGGRGR